ncbi:hypothetical protein P879_04084 [Paragonimus westermani]|uniref:Histidine kinase/HSP90-like ATPase domain-containing protein n=1 Tax=Paragonimus westermani TaxID=34504 RepID=A0A8T0DEB1_9TREM|nr:hypothetical protein P879_04084 [Paragonimus westermani]
MFCRALRLPRAGVSARYFCTRFRSQNANKQNGIICTRWQHMKNIGSCRSLATAESVPSEGTGDIHERIKGPAVKKQFRAETQKLLDIVAKSLYSEKEVFIRELISNASDAIERLRFLRTTADSADDDITLEIHMKTDEKKNLLIIQDTGIGMTKEEMEQNLGTIARSGSREFISGLNEGVTNTDIIGQFGVGFYATFMVADKVDVYSRRNTKDGADSPEYRWSSTGSNGEFELCEAENVSPGTKVVLHLKDTAAEFAREEVVEGILRKYSNFVTAPIYLNGRRINVLEPIWTKDPSKITEEEHRTFYQYLCGSTYDSPRYTFMYRTDAPLNLRVLLYVPNSKPSIFDIARESDSGVSLYSRKILIMNRTGALLPKWLRFFRGVVDSEDVPLNLSRELLQDSALINRIKRLLTARILRFLSQQSSREADQFGHFLNDFGLYLKEGLITESEQEVREQIAKLLRWETSALPAGQTTSLDEYASRMIAGERSIYFLSAPSRQLAEASPYLEAARKKSPNTEVLFLYEPYDELVLMQLAQYDQKNLRSVETMIAEDATDTDSVGPERPNCLTQAEASRLVDWAKTTLGTKVKSVKVTQRLSNHPCFVSIREAGAMRHFLRTTLADRPAEERFQVMQPILELNPEHELIRYLSTLISPDVPETNSVLAKAMIEHLFDCALAQAGLLDDVRGLASRTNELVTQMIRKVAV